MITKAVRSISPDELITRLHDYPADCSLSFEISEDAHSELVGLRWKPASNELVLVINGPEFGVIDDIRAAVSLKSDIDSALSDAESAAAYADDAARELRRLRDKL